MVINVFILVIFCIVIVSVIFIIVGRFFGIVVIINVIYIVNVVLIGFIDFKNGNILDIFIFNIFLFIIWKIININSNFVIVLEILVIKLFKFLSFIWSGVCLFVFDKFWVILFILLLFLIEVIIRVFLL